LIFNLRGKERKGKERKGKEDPSRKNLKFLTMKQSYKIWKFCEESGLFHFRIRQGKTVQLNL
jgi:hypothetical protein